MKTLKWLVAFLLLAMLSSTAAWAGHHGRFHFGVVVGGPWGPWSYAPPPYYHYPPYYPPTVIVERPAPVYIEQTPPVVAAPAPAPAPQNYWYFCPAANGYYPYVRECPTGWQKLMPQPAAQQ